MEAVQTNSPYQNTALTVRGPQPSPYEELNVNGQTRVNGRDIAEHMASIKQRDAIQAQRKLFGLSVLDGIFNFGKKLGRGACLVGGFLCSAAAVGSMFFLNIKLLGIACAIPAALFFFAATSFGKSARKEDDYALITEPVKALTEVLEHKINYLRDNPNYVFKIIQAIETMPKHHPDYATALDRLAALRETVLVEKAQLLNLYDEQSMMYQGQMDDYLAVIDNILPAKPVRMITAANQDLPELKEEQENLHGDD